VEGQRLHLYQQFGLFLGLLHLLPQLGDVLALLLEFARHAVYFFVQLLHLVVGISETYLKLLFLGLNPQQSVFVVFDLFRCLSVRNMLYGLGGLGLCFNRLGFSDFDHFYHIVFLFFGHHVRNRHIIWNLFSLTFAQIIEIEVFNKAFNVLQLGDISEMLWILLLLGDAVFGPKCETCVDWVAFGDTSERIPYFIFYYLAFLLFLQTQTMIKILVFLVEFAYCLSCISPLILQVL